jgi:isopentenyl diphosphate isomerase/L-lactate dehydrogenase-like FMN-dependent dehydrogenase
MSRYRLMPRRLVDVSKRDTGIELFGRRQAAPSSEKAGRARSER